jgi:hypothetical protein
MIGRLPNFLALLVASTLVLLAAAPAASADFGFEGVEAGFFEEDLSLATQAGSHPYEMSTTVRFNTLSDPEKGEVVDGFPKDLVVDLPPGLVINPTAAPICTNADFAKSAEQELSACPNRTAVGIVEARQPGDKLFGDRAAVYNLQPSPGSAAKLGFHILGVTVTLSGGVRDSGEYNAFATLRNLSQAEEIAGSRLILWGNPGDPSHDTERGNCFIENVPPVGGCSAEVEETAFITLPRACAGPQPTLFSADSWAEPGTFAETASEPLETTGCDKLNFGPTVAVQPTTKSAESSTGLDFDLNVEDPGLTNPGSRAESDIKMIRAILPEGMTVNPSAAEGLGACSAAEYAQESAAMSPGEGCPDSAKIGSVQVTTPLLDEPLGGSVYLAQQDDPATTTPGAENPFDTMLAVYIVIENAGYGILVKQAGKVEPNPATGRLISTFEGIPQLPFSHFHLHFREGPRAPLITPAACGTYDAQVQLTPWASPDAPLDATATFTVDSGSAGGACPSGGSKPLAPAFTAGTLSNQAGAYSPFVMQLTRSDGEQDITRFSSTLPPGLVAKLAGVGKCPDGAIEAAKSKTGREELAVPSCPSNSEIGHVMAGSGVGSALTYVPGKIYLAGPFGGDPLSVAVITPAVAGPIDAGTVVIREALTLNPETTEVQIDGAASDPIPQMLKGIPLKLRDLRVSIDRENFILNPTDCDPFTVRGVVGGSSVSALVSDRFQAANCAALPFKPTLRLRLSGGTSRGSHPVLRAKLTARPGDANIGRTTVLFPHSMFIEQEHIRTICTRVQFAAKACPAGSIYGYARAITPLLDEPLEGPVYLRANGGERELPDLVAALHGTVDVNLVGYIGSVRERLYARFLHVPDAPIRSFMLTMQGHKKGLVVASSNLCTGAQRARLELGGQNGYLLHSRPAIAVAGCGGKKGKRR